MHHMTYFLCPIDVPKKQAKPPYSRKLLEFVPFDPKKFSANAPCCRRLCYAEWEGKHDQLQAFREPLQEAGLTACQKREIYWQHAATLGAGGKKACAEWIMNVYGLRSKNKLYGGKGVERHDTPDHTRVAVMASIHDLYC